MINLVKFIISSYQVSKVGNSRQTLANNEFESDSRQNQSERQLQTILRQRTIHRERRERQC